MKYVGNTDIQDPLDEFPQIGDDDESNVIEEIKSTIKTIEDNQQNITRTIRIKSTMMISIIAAFTIILMLIFTQVILPDDAFKIPGILKDEMTSGYFIENLKGDEIDTWVSWKIVDGDYFHIHVIESPEVTQERLDVINDVIYSTETVEIPNNLLHTFPQDGSSTYYKGWAGALETISGTQFPVPTHYHSAVSDSGTGHITIRLTNLKNTDGYSGYTRSQVDESNNQILKSQLTIFNVDNLSLNELETITRHELGHAFGLAHSDNPDDLMHPTIKTDFPYINPCNVQAITELYDGNEKGTVTCEN
ncbi:MAG: matrixin family metalloprotease [Nitrosopumilus sp.]|uniref:matrixin family metalloprotease n=1 Tax=Nitrosopumilus sp. TaxID=2024843 RepID=UPI00242D4894|nr:matrixin family metalloprotease [Nitrosopumilus sp.]MCV0367243.1 matrixin family metalloprotease [Nitrosopumilus sp.]